ncbi:MAG: hypothetical protein ACI90V_013924 [Bacillariaceae sp.]|jgi:hypothetical protein
MGKWQTYRIYVVIDEPVLSSSQPNIINNGVE